MPPPCKSIIGVMLRVTMQVLSSCYKVGAVYTQRIGTEPTQALEKNGSMVFSATAMVFQPACTSVSHSKKTSKTQNGT